MDGMVARRFELVMGLIDALEGDAYDMELILADHSLTPFFDDIFSAVDCLAQEVKQRQANQSAQDDRDDQLDFGFGGLQ